MDKYQYIFFENQGIFCILLQQEHTHFPLFLQIGYCKDIYQLSSCDKSSRGQTYIYLMIYCKTELCFECCAKIQENFAMLLF